MGPLFQFAEDGVIDRAIHVLLQQGLFGLMSYGHIFPLRKGSARTIAIGRDKAV